MMRAGYLTSKQLSFWTLRRRGLTQAEVSRRIGVTPQTTNKTFNAIDAKISRALTDAAQLNRLDIRRIDLRNGFLLGYSPTWRTDALVTFSEANGIQVWYKGEGDCSDCTKLESCRQMLVRESEERGISLPRDRGRINPSHLADNLFKTIMEGPT
jgi:transcriptional regulator with XRE-family HTH domain